MVGGWRSSGAVWALMGSGLLFTGMARGLEVQVPATCREHQLVRLTAKDAVGSCSWIVLAEGLTFVDVQLIEQGKGCVFTGAPGRYAVIVIEATPTAGMLQAQAMVLIQKGSLPGPQPGPVPGPAPIPGPAPAPTPGPGPVFPVGEYDLARQSFEWGALVKSERQLGVELAKNFEGVAEGILGDGSGSRSYQSAQHAQAQLRTWNQQVLGGANDRRQLAWKPWLVEWTKRMDSLNQAGKLRWPEGVEAAYRETAAGLKEVR